MKHTIKTGLVVLVLLLAISCRKESVSTLSQSIKTEDNAAIKTGGHYIGEHYGGGIIFWIAPNGSRGLIADTVDLIGVAWTPYMTFTNTGAIGTAIGTGKANTNKIILSLGNYRRGRYAALSCAKYNGSGYRDWFLPSKDELNELFKQRRLFSGLDFNIYWSSSEFNINNTWNQYFGSGSQHYANKNTSYNIRAVRAFE